MSCGSPMPRGERIAKPAEWGTPIRPVFHSLRGEPNPEASMRTRFALVALAVALSTACGEGPLVPTSGAIRIVLTTIGADPDADGYAVTLDGAAPRTVGVNGTLVLRDLGTGAHSTSVPFTPTRSEEHTSELQSPVHLVCRLLLEKKNEPATNIRAHAHLTPPDYTHTQ